jgi:hypothetical protein
VSTGNPATEAAPRGRSRLWLIFVAVFALQLAAWIAWIIVASRHPVAEVPLTTAPHR